VPGRRSSLGHIKFSVRPGLGDGAELEIPSGPLEIDPELRRTRNRAYALCLNVNGNALMKPIAEMMRARATGSRCFRRPAERKKISDSD
jgi:hypothetical protein